MSCPGKASSPHEMKRVKVQIESQWKRLVNQILTEKWYLDQKSIFHRIDWSAPQVYLYMQKLSQRPLSILVKNPRNSAESSQMSISKEWLARSVSYTKHSSTSFSNNFSHWKANQQIIYCEASHLQSSNILLTVLTINIIKAFVN